MPDLVTHLCSALLPGVGLRLDRAALLALGTALPDIGGRVPGIVLYGLGRLGVPIPDGIGLAFGVLHQPVGVSLLAAMLSFILPERERPAATVALVGGALLHLALDLLQDHRGFGYALLFPLSTVRYEIGLIAPEATVPWAPALALLTALVWAVRLWRARRMRAG